jgi:hypothetical protein
MVGEATIESDLRQGKTGRGDKMRRPPNLYRSSVLPNGHSISRAESARQINGVNGCLTGETGD